MNKAIIIAIALLSVLAIAIVVVIVAKPVPPSVVGEYVVPEVTSDEAWHEFIKKDPAAHGYSGYWALARRGSNIAIGTALKDLRNPDPYVWINAASYLGMFRRKESVPYLIKALRHTARRSDQEHVEMLQKITGQDIGNEFNKWQEWYLSTPDAIELDWENNLGSRPRTGKDSQQNAPADLDEPRR
jgi:hypothetical protein